jgi:DNA-binding FrmR family transcriptional regulator
MVQIDDDSVEAISKRLKRAQGQIAGIIRMLEEGRECDEVVTQLAAVNKAISKAGFTMITSGLAQCYERNSSTQDVDVAKLEKLFLSLA